MPTVGTGRDSIIGIIAYLDERGRTLKAGRSVADGIFLSEMRWLISPRRSWWFEYAPFTTPWNSIVTAFCLSLDK